MKKIVKIHLREFFIREERILETDTAKINYLPWGIDAVATINGEDKRLRIPWTTIAFVEE